MPAPCAFLQKRRCVAAVGFVLVCMAVIGGEQAVRADSPGLHSPDGRLAVQIHMPPPGSAETPRWSATFRGKTILSDCRLSLEVADAGDLLAGVRVRNQHSRSVDERVPILFGKADTALDRYQETRFSLEDRRHRPVAVVFRCYDGVIAFRYEVPKQVDKERLTVTEESTSFALSGNPVAYVQYLENYQTSHEHNVATTRYRDVKLDTLLDMPVTFAWEDGTHLAITEAALRHYAGMSLLRRAGAAGKVELVRPQA